MNRLRNTAGTISLSTLLLAATVNATVISQPTPCVDVYDNVYDRSKTTKKEPCPMSEADISWIQSQMTTPSRKQYFLKDDRSEDLPSTKGKVGRTRQYHPAKGKNRHGDYTV